MSGETEACSADMGIHRIFSIFWSFLASFHMQTSNTEPMPYFLLLRILGHIALLTSPAARYQTPQASPCECPEPSIAQACQGQAVNPFPCLHVETTIKAQPYHLASKCEPNALPYPPHGCLEASEGSHRVIPAPPVSGVWGQGQGVQDGCGVAEGEPCWHIPCLPWFLSLPRLHPPDTLSSSDVSDRPIWIPVELDSGVEALS